MKHRKQYWWGVLVITLLILLVGSIVVYNQYIHGFLVGYGPSPLKANAPLPVPNLTTPAGFVVEEYARAQGARSLAAGENGAVFVGSMKVGNVYALVPTAQGVETRVLAEHLTEPNGIAYRDGDLYVVEPTRVLVLRNVMEKGTHTPEVVFDDLPTEPDHEWRVASFGPDGKLYIAIGIPCNVCERAEPYGTIIRMDVDKPAAGYEIVARGIRNSVGFEWDPTTKELWFTDNGRDWLGDDSPGDELNHVTQLGEHFGFPYCQQGNIIDPDVGENHTCSEFTPPVQILGPHVAALGMAFVPKSWPTKYQNAILIAEHGSWNRKEPSGYRVTFVGRDSEGESTAYEPFITGFLVDDNAWGRPVSLLVQEDGSVLFSDDKAGAIYRIVPPQQ